MEKPKPDWKRVRYRSIYFKIDESSEGWLKPNGDIVAWFEGFIPPGWFVLSHKNEVAEILEYLP